MLPISGLRGGPGGSGKPPVRFAHLRSIMYTIIAATITRAINPGFFDSDRDMKLVGKVRCILGVFLKTFDESDFARIDNPNQLPCLQLLLALATPLAIPRPVIKMVPAAVSSSTSGNPRPFSAARRNLLIEYSSKSNFAIG